LIAGLWPAIFLRMQGPGLSLVHAALEKNRVM
jgi:hypothetical protein